MTEKEKIQNLIADHNIVLFMKGTPASPRCGFSAVAVQILEALGASEYRTVDVLEDEGLKESLKVFSDWPTIPQLYVRGEFLGGCDIMRSMYESGDLERVLAAESVCPSAEPPAS